MTVATPQAPPADQRILLRGISWETYESLLRELEAEGQHLRLTYDRGLLEIMTISSRHAKSGVLIARIVEAYTLEMNIPLIGLSNMTWKKASIGKGAEADECYYIANADWATGRDEIDPEVDPPPDLAIEVDISRSSLDKQAIYKDLGVPELWRYENDELTIVQLTSSKQYKRVKSSPSLPDLPPAVVERFVKLRSSKTDTQIISEFTAWVRSQKKRS